MTGTWSTHTLCEKSVQVYAPAQPRPRFVLIYLHDRTPESAQPGPAQTQLFDELGVVCVCPYAPETWWVDRLCPDWDARLTAERWLLDHVLPWCETRWQITHRSVGLWGVGMGGHGAIRLACKYPLLFSSAGSIVGTLDFYEMHGVGFALDEMYDSKEQGRQDTALLHIQQGQPPRHLYFCCPPEEGMWYRGNDRLHEKLAALGVEHECDLAEAAQGVTPSYLAQQAERAIRFVVRWLEAEARRIL